MKKLLFGVGALLIGLTIATGCTNEEVLEQNNLTVVKASIEAPAARTTVSDDYKVLWSESDAFTVFAGDSKKGDLTLQGTGGTTTEDFTGTLNPALASGDVAIFPAVTGNTKAYTFPASYTTTETDAPLYGTYNGSMFSFKHLAAFIRVKANDLPAGSAVLTITSQTQALTGETTLTSGALSAPTGNGKTITVTFTATAGQDLVFDAPIPAQNYDKITLNLTVEGEQIIQKERALNAGVGKLYELTTTYTSATDIAAANTALQSVGSENKNAHVVVEEEVTGTTNQVEVPAVEGSIVTIDFADVADNAALQINSGSGTSGESQQQIAINVGNESTESAELTINTPTATVELGSGTFTTVTATTATNTLIIGEGVTINKLIVKGGNVVLKGNVKSIESEVATTITLESDITLENACVISGDITLNLNGHSIKPNYIGYGTDNDAMFVVNVGAKLTIEDSSKDETGIIDTDDASVTNLNQLHCTTAIKLLGTENYSSGPVSSFVLNSGKIKGSIYGIAGNGSKGGTEVTINGGIVDSYHSGAAIYNPQKGDVTVTGGEIISTVGIEMRSGTLNVTGGTITARAEYELCITGASASGASFSDGIIIGVSQHATNNPLNINISGGTFNIVDGGYDGLETYYALYEEDFQDEDSDNITMSITGGTFTGKIKSENCENFIKGGTFSDSSLFDYLASEAEITLGADITISANTIIPAGVTVDGKDYSISTDTEVEVAGKGKGVFLLTGGTIKNVNFTSPNTQYDIIVKAGGSVIEGCKFETASKVTNAAGTTTYGKRAIYTGSSVELTGNLTVTGCTFDDQVYAFNFLSGKNKMSVTFEDCTLGGWLSGTGASHTFTNCTFKKSGDYANYIPYCPATFNRCTFEEGFTISVKHGSTYKFDGCKYNEVDVTDPNSLQWDFSGSGTDNGNNETVTIGEESNKWTIEVGENNTITWKSSSNEGGSDA